LNGVELDLDQGRLATAVAMVRINGRASIWAPVCGSPISSPTPAQVEEAQRDNCLGDVDQLRLTILWTECEGCSVTIVVRAPSGSTTVTVWRYRGTTQAPPTGGAARATRGTHSITAPPTTGF
jgi:hypothetical protein